MAHIIRSNSKLNNPANSVGNIHNYYGPTDYKAMLDFTSNVYKVDGVKKKISEVITLTRSSEDSYLDMFGNLKWASANQPRIAYLPELNESGLLIEPGGRNLLASQANGTAFTAPNSSEKLCVSWEGSGAVTLVADGISVFETHKAFNRTYVFYNRTGAVSGTISVSGDVKNVMLYSGNHTTTYRRPNTTSATPADVTRLHDSIASLLSTGSATILCRFVEIIGTNGLQTTDYIVALNSAAPNGSIYSTTRISDASVQTANLNIGADGAAVNRAVQATSVVGNTREVNVMGLMYENKGANVGLISYGQLVTKTGNLNTPSNLDQYYLGTPPNGLVTSQFRGAILTHCVVYDRMLTEEEARNVTFMGH
jgi:hypothetical protein